MAKKSKTVVVRNTDALSVPPGYKVHTFIRVRDNSTIVPTAVDTGMAWVFRLADVPDYGEFTTLYDGFTIDRVEVTYVLQNAGADSAPTLFYAPDYDDDTPPTTVNAVTTHENVKYHVFDEAHRSVTFSVKPRIRNAAYQGGAFSGYAWSRPTFVDMADPFIAHFGAKTWLSGFNTTESPSARIRTIIKYHMKMVGQR